MLHKTRKDKRLSCGGQVVYFRVLCGVRSRKVLVRELFVGVKEKEVCE